MNGTRSNWTSGLFVLLAVFCASLSAAENDWKPLFNGKDLTGWTQRNGTATYEVAKDEDGKPTILGTTVAGSPNSFLCTDELYGDFEMEFEVKVHPSLNSGVQIRSQTRDGEKGRVNGPQVEIEASGKAGAEAGYIYGEALTGGWLTPKDQLIPHTKFKDDSWNSFRIVAKGPNIQTFINGEKVTELVDEKVFATHAKGFIGLQVHGIKGDAKWTVQWRNIRIKTTN